MAKIINFLLLLLIVSIIVTLVVSVISVNHIVSDLDSGQGSFEDTGEEICLENGKPIIILFSTLSCSHSAWISGTFDEFAIENSDKISAYHWDLDLGRNILSEEIQIIPEEHQLIFAKNNSGGLVPFFSFGCKYRRIGNSYEYHENGLALEKEEFNLVLNKLLEYI